MVHGGVFSFLHGFSGSRGVSEQRHDHVDCGFWELYILCMK